MGQDSFFQPATDATMAANMAIALRHFEQQLRVAMPARVESLGPNGTVTVQPGHQAVSAANLDERSKPAPITLLPIGNVPVVQPQGAAYSIRLPVAVHDTGLLLFSDRSLAAWLAGDGGPRNPSDPRMHDLSDAIFVPGLLTTASQAAQPSYGSDLVMQNGEAVLRVQAAGTFKIANSQQDLVALVYALAAQVDALSSALGSLTGTNAGGPVTFVASSPSTGATGPLAAVVGSILSVASRIKALVGATGS